MALAQHFVAVAGASLDLRAPEIYCYQNLLADILAFYRTSSSTRVHRAGVPDRKLRKVYGCFRDTRNKSNELKAKGFQMGNGQYKVYIFLKDVGTKSIF